LEWELTQLPVGDRPFKNEETEKLSYQATEELLNNFIQQVNNGKIKKIDTKIFESFLQYEQLSTFVNSSSANLGLSLLKLLYTRNVIIFLSFFSFPFLLFFN